MGMFDNVNYEANCIKCGESLKGFQSKDGPCELKNIDPSQVDYFYTKCEKCGVWHDFYVERKCVVNNIEVKTSHD